MDKIFYFVDKQKPLSFNKNDFGFVDIISESKQLYDLVFSPDPNTLNPRSDVYYLLSGESPEFQQFIKDKLLVTQPQGSLAETSDEAFELVNKNLYTPEQYSSIVRDYVNSHILSQNNE